LLDEIKSWLFSKDWRKYSITLLFLLHLIPIWCFKFIPTQDGLNHVYNAYILKEYNNPEYTKYREVYDLNLQLFPNWSAHAFFYVALHVMPPLIAEKLYVTLCVLLMPLSFFYFLRAMDKRLAFFGFLGFLYSYNYLLHMGFYGFALSVPMYFFAVGYWWKNRSEPNVTSIAILNVLMIITYFCHFFSFALLLLSFSLLFVTNALLPADKRRTLKQRGKTLLHNAGFVLPAYFILLNSLLSNQEAKNKGYRSFKELWDFFINVRSLVYFNDKYNLVSWGLLCFIGACILWTIWKRASERKLVEGRDGFLLLFIVSTWLYFKLPWSSGPPAWINDRMHIFLFPILLAWFTPKYPKWVKRSLIGVMLLLSLCHLYFTVQDYHLLNKDMKEFTSGAHLITPNSVVSIRTNDWCGAEHHGPIQYLSPFYHDTCYYCLGNGSHYDANYEPKYAYFPLKYKGENWKFKYVGGIIDYILVWRMDEKSDEVKKIEEDYELIHKTKNMKLYKHKQPLK